MEKYVVIRKNKTKHIHIFLAILFISVFSACDAVSQPQQLVAITMAPPIAISGKPDGQIGDQIETDVLTFTVLSLDDAISYDVRKPETGNKFIAVEIEIESHIDNFELNPLDARLQDSNGKVYFLMFGGKEPSLKRQDGLAKGAKVRGWINYEVPETVKGLWLIYEPVFSTPSKTIIVNLEK